MNIFATCSRQPWNKGKLVGQKAPLRLRDIWAIRVRLQIVERTRDLALFDLAIDSKLRACDLTKLRARDVAHGEYVSPRAMVMQQKTLRPVQFEITVQTRFAIAAWIPIRTCRAVRTSQPATWCWWLIAPLRHVLRFPLTCRARKTSPAKPSRSGRTTPWPTASATALGPCGTPRSVANLANWSAASPPSRLRPSTTPANRHGRSCTTLPTKRRAAIWQYWSVPLAPIPSIARRWTAGCLRGCTVRSHQHPGPEAVPVQGDHRLGYPAVEGCAAEGGHVRILRDPAQCTGVASRCSGEGGSGGRPGQGEERRFPIGRHDRAEGQLLRHEHLGQRRDAGIDSTPVATGYRKGC